MERETAVRLVAENLKNIFAFSLSRLYDKASAEDLTNDIACEILKSVGRLQDDAAFYGFMWRIADNTFKKFIRKNARRAAEFDESFIGAYWETPEERLENAEDINLLRRELSLLTRQYREASVAYYIYGKTCSEIARDLQISTEMVKYYLFKTRKILKEGFCMTREYGEKSYNPGTFRMDFWGGDASGYWELFKKRKLPGNILLAAYYAPLTAQELSMELGVSVPYLEDELELLAENEFLKKTGDKHQTNIIIFTDACEKEVAAKIKPLYTQAAESVNEELRKALPEFRKLDFHCPEQGENYLLWVLANLTMLFALFAADEKQKECFGEYPPLSNGSHGFVFGYDNDYRNHHFNGIYGHCENEESAAYFSVANYRVIEKSQKWQPLAWENSIKAMTDAVLEKRADENNEMLIKFIEDGFIKSNDGRLSAGFPVFSAETIEKDIKCILRPLIEIVCNCMLEACGAAAVIVKNHAPKPLHPKCGQFAAIRYQMDVMAFIIETMVDRNYLTLPKPGEKPCVFGVIR